ncbi:P-II family nitrogen regulator [Niveibacterium sp. SC-1]|uniref:P-II family nitrogen regulator n=1 Tax=Niveibacterium sp. SC-1 TaxID=3135646 RepID=UPI00311FA15B
MKEIKAYVHRSRIADVMQALKESAPFAGGDGAGRHNLTAYQVKGSLAALDRLERHYSLDLGDAVTDEYKLEFVCEDQDVDDLVAVIKQTAHTGRGASGWIYVIDVLRAEQIQ